jgi:hypothetical protein
LFFVSNLAAARRPGSPHQAVSGIISVEGHAMDITDFAILSVLIGAVVVSIGLAFRGTSFY